MRLPGELGDAVGDAIRGARDRGVRVRIMFNQDEREEEPRPFEPPPPRTEPELLEQLGVPVKADPGLARPHAPQVRRARRRGGLDGLGQLDARQLDARGERARGGRVARSSRPPTRATSQQLWQRGRIDDRDGFDAGWSRAGSAACAPWFCPGRGPELSQRIAKRIGTAQRRVRIASPVLTAGPILGTMCEVISEGRVDIAGVCDATQIRQVFGQWEDNPASRWKGPLLRRALEVFTGKDSTPYAPGSVHDFMHAKVTVADDTVFVGSFNLSRSGETNAENVLEIADAALADRMAAWIDEIRARFPRVPA